MPFRNVVKLNTVLDGQNKLTLRVVMGNRALVTDNILLGTLELDIDSELQRDALVLVETLYVSFVDFC